MRSVRIEAKNGSTSSCPKPQRRAARANEWTTRFVDQPRSSARAVSASSSSRRSAAPSPRRVSTTSSAIRTSPYTASIPSRVGASSRRAPSPNEVEYAASTTRLVRAAVRSYSRAGSLSSPTSSSRLPSPGHLPGQSSAC
ncbi:Uncharacterised protein [Mycobacteroides abscessus]|nr:Uncharacterised protein [Mycobacteroides abscessus]